MKKTYQYYLGNIVLRREHFGCIVCCFDSNLYHQLNHDAANILFCLIPNIPMSIDALINNLTEKDLDIDEMALIEFMATMQVLKIVQPYFHDKPIPYYTKQRIFNDVEKIKTDRLTAPTSVSVHITQFCPKECKHCVTNSSPRINRTNELNTEQWFSVFEKLKNFGCTSLVFTGGDCFARKDIFEIIHYAESQHFMVAILTDYDGINLEHLRSIAALKNLIDVQISLDGGTPETHDWMRGAGSFEKCLKRMEKLKEHGIGFTIASAIFDKNFHEVEKIAEISKEYGANHLYLNPLCPYGRGTSMKQNLLTEKQLYALSQKYLQLVQDKKISSGNPFWEENVDKIGDPNFNPFGHTFDHVSTGFFNMAINWEGDCYLDSKFSSEKKLCLGNINKDEIVAIWENPLLSNIRKKYQTTGDFFINKVDLLGSA